MSINTRTFQRYLCIVSGHISLKHDDNSKMKIESFMLITGRSVNVTVATESTRKQDDKISSLLSRVSLKTINNLTSASSAPGKSAEKISNLEYSY